MKIFARASYDSQLLPSSRSDSTSSRPIFSSLSSCHEELSSNVTACGCCGRRWVVSGLSALVAAVCLLVMAIRITDGRIPISMTQMTVTLAQEHNKTVGMENGVLKVSCGPDHRNPAAFHQPLLLQKQERQLQSKCEDNSYISKTLKLVYELPFASLFDDAKGQRRFDASSVIVIEDYAYAVYDKSYTIAKVSVPRLSPFSKANRQIGLPTRKEGASLDDSQFEAVFCNEDSKNFFAVQESVQDQTDETFHAMFVELSMNTNETDYEFIETCPSEFRFNKSLGISGTVASRATDDTIIVFALCAVNHCDNGDKDDKGNGRIIVMMHMPASADGSTPCQWKTLRILNIPASANFLDYSDLAITKTGRVAITSRKETEVWIGQLLGQESDGRWQVVDMAFDADVGDVYNFPRDNDCNQVYCSVDGVEWLKDDLLLMVSDKMGDSDHFRCLEKDQSMHIFTLPE